MQNKINSILLVLTFFIGVNGQAGTVTSAPDHTDRKIVRSIGQEVTFTANPGVGDVIVSLYSDSDHVTISGDGNVKTAKFNEGCEGTIVHLTFNVFHTGTEDEESCDNKDFEFDVYVPKLEVKRVLFSGSGNVRMKEAHYYTSESGSDISWPEWEKDQDTKPVLYVRNSSPKLDIVFQVTPDLGELSTTVEVKADAKQYAAENTPDKDLSYSYKSFGVTGSEATLTDFVSSDTLRNTVFAGRFSLKFTSLFDGSDTELELASQPWVPMYCTYNSPGVFASSKRINFWCIKADGASNLSELFEKVGEEATSNDHFGVGSNSNPWIALDGTDVDCVTLCKLMKESLSLLGHGEATIHYVYAKHASWDGNIIQDTPSGTFESSGHPSYYKLGYLSGGPLQYLFNQWEGVCKVNNGSSYMYWMGGTGTYKDRPSEVLFYVAGARSLPINKQIFENNAVFENFDERVPYPSESLPTTTPPY